MVAPFLAFTLPQIDLYGTSLPMVCLQPDLLIRRFKRIVYKELG